jgi:adenylate cyclase
MAGFREDIGIALRTGDYFRAYDLAISDLEANPNNLYSQYAILLSLARTGANRQARARLTTLLDVTKSINDIPPQLAEDFAAMDGRLFKNLALEESGEKRRTLAAQSAHRYENAYSIRGGYFPAINAATMWLIADEPEKSRAMAQNALADIGQTPNEYWPLATAAEAYLLLGEATKARGALAAALASPAVDFANVAVTRRQLAMICDKLAVSWPSIDLPPSSVIIHYCADGNAELSSSEADELSAKIDQLISGQNLISAFGTIRNNTELFLTERLLARGVDVQLILPSEARILADTNRDSHDTFFHQLMACLGKLRSPFLVMSSGAPISHALLVHSVRCAMGLAIMRANLLMIEASQIVIRCDRHDADSDTTNVMDIWNRLGRNQTIIDCPAERSEIVSELPLSDYETKAFVFCDIKGFSKVPEMTLPLFVDQVLGGLAEEIDKYQSELEYKETAGDGIYIVLRNVVAAANCALAMVARMNRLPSGPLSSLGIRVSAHVGAVFPVIDPVTGYRKFFGTEIIRAARIEPITPVGECYVTEQFASILALEAPKGFNCDYAGVLESAKGYGAFRMYSMRVRKTADQI